MKTLFIVIFISCFSFALDKVTLIDVNETKDTVYFRSLYKNSVDLNNTYLRDGTQLEKITYNKDLSTLLYIMIDTSSPMNESYFKDIKFLLEQNLPKFKNDKNYSVIISTFDKNSQIVYNNSQNKNLDFLNNINVNGKMTELFRNTKDSIENMRKIKKDRKVLIIFSDGDAEDTNAYNLNDVVTLAKESNIRILSFGYRNTINLQNLRKMSEDTNGDFWSADEISNKLNIDLYQEIKKSVQEEFDFIVPKDMLNISYNKDGIELAIDKNGTKKELIIKEKNITKSFFETYLYYIFTFCLFIAISIYFFIKRYKSLNSIVEENPIEEEEEIVVKKPIAFFESMGGAKHFIYKFPSTIGKKTTNDVIIHGEYISRNHAIVDFKDGFFYIQDIDSLNGLTINGRKVIDKANIKPNDKIGFGLYITIFRIGE